MKAASAIGIAIAFVGLAVGAMMEGSQLPAFFNVPAMIIIFSGTFGATLAATSIEGVKKLPALYKLAFSPPELHLRKQADLMVFFAEKARRDGLLALDEEVQKLGDEYTKKGLQLVVDGSDPEVVQAILEAEMDGMAARHAEGAEVFKQAGGFAPTIGILGTVLGLVHVLENLDAPETLGPSISGAFIATLYGVGAANLVFLPIANKLKSVSEAELELRTLTLEGVLAIQAGDNPRIVADKLAAFMPPGERESEREAKGTAPAAAPVGEPARQ